MSYGVGQYQGNQYQSGLDTEYSTNCKLLIGLAAFATAVAITFIALGALGAQGQLAMAPIGAEIMITLGVALICGMISGVVKYQCATY